jgi:cytochrome bd ubiquinol oxidase subunit II
LNEEAPVEAFWFAVVSVMLAVYVVLDGFDFGVGIVHRVVAQTDQERRTALAAIGPVWDGNEVWLIAAGGVFFFAFPHAYAASFSGFYLPLVIVLWLLILRGIAIEFRSHHESPLWREFWDFTFTAASALMALVLGTSLANVIRGVPIDETGYFAMPLFTDFWPGREPGIFDWYTLLVGLFTLVALAGHGALYLVWKTDGPVQARARAIAHQAWFALLAFWPAVTAATVWLRPDLYANLLARPWTIALVLMALAGFAGIFHFTRRGAELAAFLSSSTFLLAILAATMAGQYPDLLRSTLDPAFNVTAENAAAGAHGLRVGAIWWTIGIVLAIGYYVFLFRSFRGKAQANVEGHGY